MTVTVLWLGQSPNCLKEAYPKEVVLLLEIRKTRRETDWGRGELKL